MNTLKSFVVILILLVTSKMVNAQGSCGCPSIDQMINDNPEQFAKFDKDLINITKENQLPVGYYTPNSAPSAVGAPQASIISSTMLATDQVIPVVFHLIGNAANALTDAQITAALAKLNVEFNSIGTAPAASNPRIRFCLAQNPPGGKTFTNHTMNGVNRFGGTGTVTYQDNGMTFTKTYDYIANHIMTEDYGSFNFGPCYTPGNFNAFFNLVQVDVFNPQQYLNIYVVNQISTPLNSSPCGVLNQLNPTLGGYASFYPGFAFVVVSSAISDPSSDILAHEAGHYLSLFHTFEGGSALGSTYSNVLPAPNLSAPACAWDGDRCCDTPPVASNGNFGNLGTNCSTAGTTKNTVIDNYFAGGFDRNDMIENFMDYSGNDCKNTFTVDQVLRMKYTLAYYRNVLCSGANLVFTGVNACANTANVVYSDFEPIDPTTNMIKEIGCKNIDDFNFKTANLSGYTYLWNIIPTTYTGTMSGANPINIKFTTSGTYTITLTASKVVAGITYTSNTKQEIIISDCTPINNNRSNWYFGDYNSISFSTGIAKQAPNSLIRSLQPTASYCYNTSNGNTIYTDGKNLWCKVGGTHTIISSSLNGYCNPFIGNTYPFNRTLGNRSTIICPKPGNANRLLIFTSSNFGTIQNGLSQYEVDLSTATPTLISTVPVNPINNYQIMPCLNIVPHDNGTEYWLLVQPISNTLANASLNNITNPDGSLLAYLITNTGFQNLPPIESKLNILTYGNIDYQQQQMLVMSPDRKRIAFFTRYLPNLFASTTFANFDCKSGIANVVKTVPTHSREFFGSFSPNSRFYYTMSGSEMVQFDLENISYCNNDIPFRFFGNLFNNSLTNAQIGPDNRIYFKSSLQAGAEKYLSVIDKPNLLVNSSNNIGYAVYGVGLNGEANTGLPNDIICASGATINDFSFQNCACGLVCFTSLKAGINFTWNFGDGNTLTGTNSVIPLLTHNGTTYNNYEYPCHIYQAAGTYTVTLKVDGHPLITKVITISLPPPPVPIISNSSNICSNTKTFTTPVSYPAYLWQANVASPISGTNPSFTTIYQTPINNIIKLTITNTAGCINSKAQIVTNSFIKDSIATSDNTTSCIGAQLTNFTFYGSGVYNYIWTLPNNTTINNINCNASLAGVYTCTVTDANTGCTTTATYTINSSPVLNSLLIVNSNSPCISATNPVSVSISATGLAIPFTYTGVGLTTGALVSQGSPSNNFLINANGNYLFTVIDTNGCTKDTTISLTSTTGNFCCFNPMPANMIYLSNANSATLPLNNSNKNYYIHGTFTVNSNVSFTNCNFWFTTGAKMEVSNNQTLKLKGCSLQSGCNGMWNGIIADHSTEQVEIDSCLIYDCQNVSINFNAKLICKNSTFTDCYTGIVLGNTNGALSNIIITNNTFKSDPAWKGANLLPPYNANTQSIRGILINNATNINIGSSGNIANGNTFRDIRTGIFIYLAATAGMTYSTSQYINLYYNKFKNIRATTNLTWMPSVANGKCIVANNANVAAPPKLNIYGNLPNTYVINMDSVDLGIQITKMEGRIHRNKMKRTKAGISINAMPAANIVIDENRIEDCVLGIAKSGNNKNTSIYNDTIIINSNATFYPSTYINLAIPPTGIKCTYSTNYVPTGTTRNGNINNCLIQMPLDTGVCISIENGFRDRVSNNVINCSHTSNPPTGTVGLVKLIGINLDNCLSNVLTNNNAQCTVPGGFVSGHSAGLYLNKATNIQLFCNNFNRFNYGVYAISQSGNDNIHTNIAGNTFYGKSNSVYLYPLGQEGSLGKIGNALINTTSYDANNYYFKGTTTSTVFNHKWYRTTFANACNTNVSIGVSTVNGKLTQLESQSNNTVCKVPVNNNGNSFAQTYSVSCAYSSGNTNTGTSLTNTDIDPSTGEDIATDQIEYVDYEDASARADKELLYSWLEDHPTERTASYILDSFYQHKYSQEIGQLNRIAFAISQLGDSTIVNNQSLFENQWNVANELNSNFVASTHYGTNLKQANTWHLLIIKEGAEIIEATEWESIYTLANSCPLLEGNGVYTARLILSNFEAGLHYNDLLICNSAGLYKGGESKLQQQLNAIKALESLELNTSDFTLYPNPATNIVKTQYQFKPNENGELKILDMVGKVISTYQLNSNVTIPLDNMTNGVYLYTFTTNQGKTFTGKLKIE